MGKKKIPVDKIICYVCADTGSVPLMYVDKNCGAFEGKKLVQCPKCRPQK